MKVIFAGGGTGGHINPALSVAGFSAKQDENFEALFIGTKRGLETKLVPKAGYNIEYIDIEGFNRKNLLKNIKVLKKLHDSQKKCVKIMREFKPDCVVCTGGYVSGPVAVAAAKFGIPALIHEQNVYPGFTVAAAEKYVDYVAVSFDETVNHMKDKKKCVVTGNPVRDEIINADREAARRELGIESNKPFVLIFGGSLGAGKINEAVIDMLPKLMEENKFRILFATGDRNFDEITAAVREKCGELTNAVEIVPYINNMHTVMAAADLAVCRAGAITVSELAVLKKPSVLIPSPNVVRNHQEQNAREVEAKGGCVVLCESELSGASLYKIICDTVSDTEKLIEMSDNLDKMRKIDANSRIYELMCSMAMKNSHSK